MLNAPAIRRSYSGPAKPLLQQAVTQAVGQDVILIETHLNVVSGNAGTKLERLRGIPMMEQANIARVPVVADSQVLGILSREAVIHYLRVRTEIGT